MGVSLFAKNCWKNLSTMITTLAIPKISKHQLVLALLGLDKQSISIKGIGGSTRINKLLFLAWQEGGIQEVEEYFDFKPYYTGPLSQKLYDELELLYNLDFIKTKITGIAVDEEAIEIKELAFGHCINDNIETADSFEERHFIVTPKGITLIKEFITKPEFSIIINNISKIKSKFSNYSLQDLLYYMFTKYNDWIIKSNISNKVLQKGNIC